jgi:hypothetical protein
MLRKPSRDKVLLRSAKCYFRPFSQLGIYGSRAAKIEAGDSSVSLDLLVRSILALGVSGKGLIQSLSTRKSSRAA